MGDGTANNTDMPYMTQGRDLFVSSESPSRTMFHDGHDMRSERVEFVRSRFRGERPINRDIDQIRGRPVLGQERDLLEVVEDRRELVRARGRPHELADRGVQRKVGRVRERDVRLRKEPDGLGQREARCDCAPGKDLVGIRHVGDGLQCYLESSEVPMEPAGEGDG